MIRCISQRLVVVVEKTRNQDKVIETRLVGADKFLHKRDSHCTIAPHGKGTR